MADSFTITVSLHGRERSFDAGWQQMGYTHRFTVRLDDIIIYFEPDEEGHYRTIIAPGQDEKKVTAIDKEWLEAIQQTLQDA
jgi:hypothetical protein